MVRRAWDPVYGLLRLGEKGQQKRRTGKDRRDVRDPTEAPRETARAEGDGESDAVRDQAVMGCC